MKSAFNVNEEGGKWVREKEEDVMEPDPQRVVE
jgi:hypothetical protein